MYQHIFFTFISRRDKPFSKIISQLSTDNNNTVIEFNFEIENGDLTRRVEYSWRRRFRLLYYRNLYRKIDIEVGKSINRQCKTLVYTSDEGVWSELIKTILKKYIAVDRIRLINVQHGMLLTRPIKTLLIRKKINHLLNLIIGYPIYGLGFGGSRFDLYLTYSSYEALYLRNVLGLKANSTLALIKPRLSACASLRQLNGTSNKFVLLALQPVIEGIYRSTGLKLYEDLASLIGAIKIKSGLPIKVRFHPGMNQDVTMNLISRSKLGNLIQYDFTEDLYDLLADASIVLSFNSTVLCETSWVGNIPIQIKGVSENFDLPTPHETIHINRWLSHEIDSIVSSNLSSKYDEYCRSLKDDFTNWELIFKEIFNTKGNL